jgi:hypothetical protein
LCVYVGNTFETFTISANITWRTDNSGEFYQSPDDPDGAFMPGALEAVPAALPQVAAGYTSKELTGRAITQVMRNG